MDLEVRRVARKNGQISTRYATEVSFPENGIYRAISAGKVSGTIAGSPHAEPGSDLRTGAEVKSLLKTVPGRYPPGIVTGTRYGPSRRPESALEDTLNRRLDCRDTLCCRKTVVFSVITKTAVFSVLVKPPNGALAKTPI